MLEFLSYPPISEDRIYHQSSLIGSCLDSIASFSVNWQTAGRAEMTFEEIENRPAAQSRTRHLCFAPKDSKPLDPSQHIMFHKIPVVDLK